MDGAKENKKVKRQKSLASNVWFLVITAVLLSSGLLFITSLYLAWSAIIVTTRQRMLDIANCAAGSVNGDILETITADDKDTPEYQKIYDALAVYRDNVELEYVYGIKDEGNGRFTFTVDPAINDPGDFGADVIVTDALITASKGTSAVDEKPYRDDWGSFYSAYSPVFDSKGNVAGIIAADFSVEWYESQLKDQAYLAAAMYLAILVITLSGVGFLCFIRARSIVRPIKQITEIAGRYEKGDFSGRLEVEREDEIGVLSRSLQSMATSLAEQVKKAEIASSAKSDFLAKMSHEIRTPINAILGMNEMIRRESDDTDILMYSDNIKKAGGVLLSIINGILDLSKIEAGKMEITPVGYDLSLLLNDIVNLIKVYAEEKGLSFVTDFDPEIPKMLKGDEIRIKQIITNILVNAVKYTEKGSVTFTVGYDKDESDPDNIILNVSVKDTGVGIRKEDMDRLFSGFERLDEKRNRYVEGTGLGISITNSLLEMMGSSLHVESVYGKGSEFSFSLLQKALSRETLGDFRDSDVREEYRSSSVRERYTAPDAEILAIDDNPMNLMVFKSLLKRILVKVDTAESGEEGLKYIKIKHYDMIFLDHMMPGMDGIETLDEIRAGERGGNVRTPVICLTANAILGSRERYIEAGFDEYLSKPLDSDKLEEMILKFLPEEKKKGPVEGMEDKRQVKDNVIPEKLTALDGETLDVKNGVKNSGSVSYYLTLLKMFQKSAESSIEVLNSLLSDRDFKNYTVKVHAIKSSAFIIGATALGKDALKLEEAGKNRDEAYLLENHGRFTEDVLKLRDSLSGVFEEDEEGAKIEADDIVIGEAYEKVRDAAEDMDYDRLESVINGMSVYEMPEHEAENWRKIVDAFEAYDYSTILSLVKNNH